MPKREKQKKVKKAIDSIDFLKSIGTDRYTFMKKNKGKKFIISGPVGNYQPTIDCIWLNKGNERILLVFKIGDLSGTHYDIREGTRIAIEGIFNFLNYFDNNRLNPSFAHCKFIAIGEQVPIPIEEKKITKKKKKNSKKSERFDQMEFLL